MEMTAKNFRLVGEGNYDRQTARVIDHVLCGEPVTKKLQSIAMALIDMIDEGTTWQDGQRRQFLALMCPVGDVTADDIARAQKRLGIK